MSLPTLQTPFDALQAKFKHLESSVELRMQCFLTIRDKEGRVGLVRIEGVEGWCLPGESMRVNESPDQAAVRTARSWFATPMGLWLERVVSFPATSLDDNKWYVVFVYGADAPEALQGTPDTQEIAFFPPDATPGPFAFSHAEMWNALR